MKNMLKEESLFSAEALLILVLFSEPFAESLFKTTSLTAPSPPDPDEDCELEESELPLPPLLEPPPEELELEEPPLLEPPPEELELEEPPL